MTEAFIVGGLVALGLLIAVVIEAIRRKRRGRDDDNS